MPNNLNNELNAAILAVRTAAVACQAVAENLVTNDTLNKKDKSPVTIADFASQAIVCELLNEALGPVDVVGEEAAGALRENDQEATRAKVAEHVRAAMNRDLTESQILASIDKGNAAGDTDRYWTIDPIDGTKGFLRKEQYVIALALIEKGEVILGVLGCPNLPTTLDQPSTNNGVLLTAVQGQGTTMRSLNDPASAAQPVHVSNITDPAAARFCESVESGHSSHNDAAKVAQLLGITAEPVRMDSQAKYAAVARGDASIYLRLPTSTTYRENIWDHAAGLIVVQEAGGQVTDIKGQELDFTQGQRLENNQGIIATNGPIHKAVVKAVGEVVG